ncbi:MULTISPECIES: aminoglycoside phosphotransferase family protein [Roseobacteraceae]|jgi:aminoglycoside/choline kinase family phosphotransferase|uniref:Phosphotransferase enzyme family protein n=1 Tax=Pseudosulfitobacter pseudonitzschiae TaxID=1402135 RepID=A0A221K563_9RHOB|nr:MULTISPECIES: phosphotransferase [Roseobacteraceae]ASM73987.1 phosphotransferase enzyme family protein [Pseudosulfitobacter pseudonitzschiae]
MTDRATRMAHFITTAGWQDATRTTVAGDASNRRYDRLTISAGNTAILMDAPPEKGEDVRPFVHIATFLRAQGLSAPAILAQDDTHGFLLLEDLGDDLFARVLTREPALELPLYQAATDVLVALHRATPPALAAYDADTMTPLAALAFDWYQAGATGAVNTQEKARFSTAFHAALAPLDATAPVLIQRDYHAENLLWLPDRDGFARVGLLDFQDAMAGHPAYDLVSILQDARRDVPASIETQMIERYTTVTTQDATGFARAYALLGLQRNLRILGVFARLSIRDGKAHYVDLIPRVWGHIQTNLKHPDAAPLADLLTGLPVPDVQTLNRIKSRCAKQR